MKRSICAIAVVLLLAGNVVLATGQWQKYVAPDKAFSFHYPSGWNVKADGGAIEIGSPAGSEQIVIAGVPYDPSKTPKELAEGMIELLRQAAPDLKAENWTASAENMVGSQISYTEGGRNFQGAALVMKSDGAAQWFCYSCPKQAYSPERAGALLSAVISTMAPGADSEPPASPESAAAPAEGSRIERNAQAFMFVLEFALGAPLTASQEKVILVELKSDWSTRTAEELAKYDEYPSVVDGLLKAKSGDLEGIRKTLEQTVREVLDASDKTDPAMKVIRAQLEQKGKIAAAGKPPLTEMAATAYSELIAYSELLHKQPEAAPSSVSSQTVARIRKQLIKAWKGFSAKDRGEVLGTPALWVRTRKLLEYGTPEEREGVRDALRKVTATYAAPKPKQPVSSSKTSPAKGSGAAMSNTKHWAMMQIQQQTFNSYMTSRGFSGWTYTGKMW